MRNLLFKLIRSKLARLNVNYLLTLLTKTHANIYYLFLSPFIKTKKKKLKNLLYAAYISKIKVRNTTRDNVSLTAVKRFYN